MTRDWCRWKKKNNSTPTCVNCTAGAINSLRVWHISSGVWRKTACFAMMQHPVQGDVHRMTPPSCQHLEQPRDLAICCEVPMLSNHWISILLMEEILQQLIGSLSQYLQRFVHPRWLFGISEPSTVLHLQHPLQLFHIGFCLPIDLEHDHTGGFGKSSIWILGCEMSPQMWEMMFCFSGSPSLKHNNPNCWLLRGGASQQIPLKN